MKPFRTQRLDLRGLDAQVLTWGDPEAPRLFLLHGWMDVAASFQFLVDALARDWHVVAPDLRGYGGSEWQPQGYWFGDYIADLEALLDRLAPGERANIAGHSLGGNVVLHYAGVRPERVRTVISLDAFGLRAEQPAQAQDKIAKWLEAMAAPRGFRRYASLDAVADRLQKNNPRLPRDMARFLAGHWAEALPDGSARLRSDPRHMLPFPTVYRIDEIYAVWARIAAPTLWIAAAESHIPKWLARHPEGEGATDSFVEIRGRIANIPNAELVVIPDAGHMLHHDQPRAVAAAMEAFLDAHGARAA